MADKKKPPSRLKKAAMAGVAATAMAVASIAPAKDTQAIIEWHELPDRARSIPDNFNPLEDGILMRHQTDVIALTHQFEITAVPKGRRTGITFAIALDKSLVAAAAKSAGGDNVYYIGDTKEKGLEFIGYCAKFLRTIAKAQGQGVSGIEEFLFEDQDKEGNTKKITSYRIRLASGHQIVALSSRPENIRGLQGHVVIDEAAFHKNVQEVLDAATALLIWGGRIVIISSHNGKQNPFYAFIQDIEKGMYGDTAATMTVTFDDAVTNGIYERVCLIKGETPTAEGKKKWYEKVRNGYGNRKAQMREELDAIPRDGNSVSIPTVWIENAMRPDRAVIRLALDDDFAKKPPNERRSYVVDWIARYLTPELEKLNPKLRWYFGQDYARHRDFSMLVPLAIETNMNRTVPFVLEMNNVPVAQQHQILWAFVDGLPNFQGGAFDATGSGETTAELAADKYGVNRIEQVKLNRTWYGQYMPKMISLFEGATLTIPKDANLEQDIRAIEEVDGIPLINKQRRADLKDPDLVRHGDFSPALCLANYAFLQVPQGMPKINSRPADRDAGVETGIRALAGRFKTMIRGY